MNIGDKVKTKDGRVGEVIGLTDKRTAADVAGAWVRLIDPNVGLVERWLPISELEVVK